jgi:hypothetical protein
MKFVRITAVAGTLSAVVTLSGCATALTSTQKSELRGYEAKGLMVQEKTPSTGAVLGILPGGGSFYAQEPWLGVVNLLMWPLSVLWDPFSGYQGSEAINYRETKAVVGKSMNKELQALADEKAMGSLSEEQYVLRRREIEKKYSPDA